MPKGGLILIAKLLSWLFVWPMAKTGQYTFQCDSIQFYLLHRLVPSLQFIGQSAYQGQMPADLLGDSVSGVFGVEMFVTTLKKDGNPGQGQQPQQVSLNKIAPRLHKSGQYTENDVWSVNLKVSQFENHLQAICGLPPVIIQVVVEAAAMVNVLEVASGSMEDTMQSFRAALAMLCAVGR
jgi:phosphoribosylaminoimidazole carboxylase (NCAIR synthetase)